jgi:hypothetical protein
MAGAVQDNDFPAANTCRNSDAAIHLFAFDMPGHELEGEITETPTDEKQLPIKNPIIFQRQQKSPRAAGGGKFQM